jgi:hypothetical protein
VCIRIPSHPPTSSPTFVSAIKNKIISFVGKLTKLEINALSKINQTHKDRSGGKEICGNWWGRT